MKLSELFIGTEISETNIESFDIDINDITVNSKEVKRGSLFISQKGSFEDGHGYIREALSNRAAVIVIEDRRFSGDFPYIRVPSTRRAYSALWNNYCGDPSHLLKLIAVTGTNGKSTVVSMITHILNSCGHKACAIGTLNSSLTTPDPPELYPRLKEISKEGNEYAVMEISSHALELEKVAPLHFDIGIFTNLTRDHLDYHSNMYSYARAKSKLFYNTDLALYNYDDKYAKEIITGAKKGYSFSACSDEADFTAKNISFDIHGGRYDYLACGELFPVEIPLSGRYNILNSLASVACCRLLGIEAPPVRKAMKNMPGVSGRMERVKLLTDEYKAFIDYAHTPDALKNLLGSLAQLKDDGRLVCIFGCGGDRDRGKRAEMGMIACELADLAIITSDNPRSEDPYSIIRDILKDVKERKNHLVIEDRRRAIQYAVHTARKNDILVFCGKGHEKYEINRFGRVGFDEKQIIQEADKERIGIRGNEYYPYRQNENVTGRDS